MPAFLAGSPVTVAAPYRDTRDTVGHLIEALRWSYADVGTFARGRALVEDLCREIVPKDYLSEYLAILRWVERHVRYVRDPEAVELVKTPDAIFGAVAKYGVAQEDCESIALLLAFLCGCVGGRVRFLTCSFVREPMPATWQDAEHWPPHTHAFMQAFVPGGRWVTFDPVAGNQVKTMLNGGASQLRIFPVN